ncbi:MAG: shikimate dehydrogenase [Pseudomonadota bacterium]
MTDHYAVFGNPIAHSRSPFIHQRFAEDTAQDLVYTAETAPLDGFADAAARFFADGGRGCNVTVPFKLDAATFADDLTDAAGRAGAVNTLIRTERGLLGDNTDGIGLVRDLGTHCGVALRAARVLVLGAGGAVRGVLQPILAQQPAQVVIANRSADKAEKLAAAFADLGPITACPLDAPATQDFDVVINGTSSGLSGDVPALAPQCVRGAVSYDMVYAHAATPFQAWSRTNGARAAFDGLGMLVEQAAESFERWRGVRPETARVRAALRAAL